MNGFDRDAGLVECRLQGRVLALPNGPRRLEDLVHAPAGEYSRDRDVSPRERWLGPLEVHLAPVPGLLDGLHRVRVVLGLVPVVGFVLVEAALLGDRLRERYSIKGARSPVWVTR